MRDGRDGGIAGSLSATWSAPRWYSLWAVMEVLGASPTTVVEPATSEEAQLPRFLDRVAADLVSILDPFARGGLDLRARIEEHLALEVREAQEAAELRRALATSEVAWARRDHAAVVQALGTVEQQLSPAERARLAHCRKQLHG